MTDNCRNISPIKGICSVCGGEYTGLSRKKRYCSDACRQVAYKQRNFMYTYQNPELTRLESISFTNEQLKLHNSQLAKDRYYLLIAKDQLQAKVDKLTLQLEISMNRVDQLTNNKPETNS